MRGDMTVSAAVAAAVLAEHGGSLDVCGVDVRAYPAPTTGAEVSMQAASCMEWKADLVRVARAGAVLGFAHVRFYPDTGFVRVAVVGEVSTPAGTARVEVWEHLTGDDIDRAARLLGIGLDRDTDPVFVAVADVLRLVESQAVA